MRSIHPTFVALLVFAAVARAEPPKKLETGSVRFTPGDQANIPERYRLDARAFDFELERKTDLPANELTIYRLRFPSAVESPHKENNTVHAEYYRPHGDGPFPGVIVLDIT